MKFTPFHTMRNMAPLKITYDETIEKAIEIIEPAVNRMLNNKLNSRWTALKLLDGDKTLLKSIRKYIGFDLIENADVAHKINEAKEVLYEAGIEPDTLRDRIVSRIVSHAERICRKAVIFENLKYNQTDRRIDKVLTSRIFGLPIMLTLLGVIFWLTITGANYPSQMLADGLFWIEDQLTVFFAWLGTPAWIHGILVLGIYRTLAWVVSVMLPPMAIFFPLFTLLEDFGYLPRVAFNLDKYFKKACACGKQALTMCMGFGCNAAGVVGCRIIESPRERLIATITNNFVPCNGRFPHADRDHYDVFCRSRYRAVSIHRFRADLGGHHPVRHSYDVVHFQNSLQNRIERRPLFVYVRASSLSKTADRKNHCPVDIRQNSFCAGACCHGGRTRRADHMDIGQYHRGRHKYIGALRKLF